jgi:hypothetical protein
MNQPAGSVYLDASQPMRRQEPKGVRCIRRTLAGLLTLIGIVALSVTALLCGFHLLASNPDTIVEAVNKTLDDPVVQQELESELASAIESRLVGIDTAKVATSVGLDATDEARRLAPIILADATFRAELETIIVTAHDQVLLNASEAPIDFTAMTTAVVSVIESESPPLAQMLLADRQLFEVTTGSLPDLTGPVSQFERLLLFTALASLALPLAGFLHPHYDRVVAWTGRWLLFAGLLAALAAITLPKVAGAASGFRAAEVAVQTMTTRLLGPAALAGVIGMGLVSIASVLANRRRNATSDHGAAHALGLNEPERFPMAQGSQLDLPKRGLVDVAHPLTNI